ncbi:MAG: cytochrome-c oxidase, cbb3-type subunit III [Alphaproteobacteria bacterium]
MSDNTHEKKTNKDIDEATGVETTGHEWDGLKELNNPLPRWWVWVWLVTIIWSVGYWVVYPTWPTPDGATKGTSGYTQFKELAESQQEIIDRQRVYLEKFESASLDEIRNDKALYAFAIAGGKSAFKDNCATCHGSGATGSKGYPNLNDDDWIWGGTVDAIYETLQYGIRGKHDDTRISQMPAFGKDELLSPKEIDAVVDYVLALSGGKKHANYVQGATIFEEQCASCHGDDGRGIQDYGAPNLADKIWLYGGDRETVYQTVYTARAGVMPAWENRLSDNTLKQLTIYLHQLGGGEEEPENGEQEIVPDEQ